MMAAAGCAPEFEEATCESDSDCFDDEQCVEGVCRLAVGGQGDGGMPSEVAEGEPESLLVSPRSVEVGVGHEVRLHATVLDGENNRLEGTGISWSSSDSAVLEVAPPTDGEGETDRSVGVVDAKATGSATVTASVQGLETDATVEVVPSEVGRVEVSPEAPQVEVGQQVELSATPYDTLGNELTDRQVEWESTDTDVAEVDSDGVVEGFNVGEAEIVATVEGVEGRASLEVIETQVASVTITPEEPDALAPNETLELVAMPNDGNGDPLCSEEDAQGTETPCGRTVSWTSGSSSVATVDATGVVTAQQAGTVTIFADIAGETGTVELEVEEGNAAPTAEAGSDKTTHRGGEVTLDGTGSSDPDGADAGSQSSSSASADSRSEERRGGKECRSRWAPGH